MTYNTILNDFVKFAIVLLVSQKNTFSSATADSKDEPTFLVTLSDGSIGVPINIVLPCCDNCTNSAFIFVKWVHDEELPEVFVLFSQ